ncbi:hypothetical protein JXJ21_09975, partial [candidate division KSB1 bacterium]|nr:hypothetical protein [candidate division KSB1 bacterium]
MDFVIDGPHYSLSTRFLMIAAIVCIAALLLNAIRIIHSVKGILRLKKSEERLKDSVIRLDFPFFKSEPGEPLSVDISGDVQGIGIQIDRILKNFQYQIAKRIGFFQFFLFMSLIMGILSIHFSWVMFDHYYQSTGVKEFQFFIRDCM